LKISIPFFRAGIAILIAIPGLYPSLAKAETTLTRELIQSCSVSKSDLDFESNDDFCVYFILGVANGINSSGVRSRAGGSLACRPEAVSTGQLRSKVVAYLLNEKISINAPAADSVTSALQNLYPCKENTAVRTPSPTSHFSQKVRVEFVSLASKGNIITATIRIHNDGSEEVGVALASLDTSINANVFLRDSAGGFCKLIQMNMPGGTLHYILLERFPQYNKVLDPYLSFIEPGGKSDETMIFYPQFCQSRIQSTENISFSGSLLTYTDGKSANAKFSFSGLTMMQSDNR
jgi:Rap1a immunity proteins